MSKKSFEKACLELTAFATFPENMDFRLESIARNAEKYLEDNLSAFESSEDHPILIEGVDFETGKIFDPSLFVASSSDLSLLKETAAIRQLSTAVALERFTDPSDRIAQDEIKRLRFDATETLSDLGHALMDQKLLVRGSTEQIAQLKADLENQHVDDLWTVTQVKMKNDDGTACVVHFPESRQNEILALAEESTGVSAMKLVSGIRSTPGCVAGYVDAEDYDELFPKKEAVLDHMREKSSQNHRESNFNSEINL